MNPYYASLTVEMRWESFETLELFVNDAAKFAAGQERIELENLASHVRSLLQRRPEQPADPLAGLL